MKYYEYTISIDKFLAGDASINKAEIYDLIKTDQEVRSYFFTSLNKKDLFKDLKDQGWFNPLTITTDDKGNVVSFWDVLDYIERISKQPALSSELAIEFMAIINELVELPRSGKRIRNYHIWWYCVRILNNIPNEFIAQNLIEDKGSTRFSFRMWLMAWLGRESTSDLAISDIGEKLLKKFLDDKRTIPLAEAIIDVITDVKRSEKEDYFTKNSDALLRWQPFWILKSLQQQAKTIGRACGNETIFLIANKLLLALECEREVSRVIFEIDKSVYQLSISRKRLVVATDRDALNYDPGKYLCRLDQYSESQVKENLEKKDYWYLHCNSPETPVKNEEEFRSLTQEEFIAWIEKFFPSGIDWKKDPDYKKKLKNSYRAFFEDYSQVWFKSIDEGGTDHSSKATEVLTIVLRDIIVARHDADPAAGKQIIDVFLTKKYPFPIFTKLALYCIGRYWDKENLEKFKGFVRSRERALDNPDWEVEVFDILKNHNKDFDGELADLIKKDIEDVPEYYRKENWMATQWQFNRLSPLKDNENFKSMYSEVELQARSKKEYAPERTAIKGGFITHASPVTSTEILSKPNSDIVQYLKEYKGADSWHGTFEGAPDREGLANALQAAAKENPSKFISEIDLYYDASYFYVHHLVSGLKDSWVANKDIDWEKLLPFCQKFLKRPNLIMEALENQGSDSSKGRYIWFIEDVVGLIQSGSSKDERAFDKKYFDLVSNIFETIYPLLKEDVERPIDRDALTYALNTTLGKVVEAFIIFSLRVARVEGKRPEGWGERYKKFFRNGIEAYVWLGRYLPNMIFLDERFTQEKITEMSVPDDLSAGWRSFMEGFLKGASVYDFYELMRAHYIKAIKNPIMDDWTDKRLVQHIAIWYIRGKDEVTGSDSLFRMVLEDVSTPEKKRRWFELVSFFWSLSKRTLKEENNNDDPSQKTVDRILAFWKWTVDEALFVKEKLGDEYYLFLGSLAELTILLPELNAEAERLLMLSAPHVERHHDATFFIEYLTRYEKREELERIGRIYLTMLKNTTPTFREEDIQTIARRMYETGDAKIKGVADEICNTYGRRGIHFLKDLYFKFNAIE